ncbi:phosphopantetheine-protein transferase domain-containing protein [Cyclospora cayetanensis]|nr:phosphopantetheine-protein transferase domain-containing protein [Cyclospora cayetanensis]
MCRYTSRLLSPIEAAQLRRLQPTLFAAHWTLRRQQRKPQQLQGMQSTPSTTLSSSTATKTPSSSDVGRPAPAPAPAAAIRSAARFLGRRFAAKEAAAKALGVGLRILSPGGLSLSEIEVQHLAEGKPLLLLRNKAEAMRRLRHVRAMLLSSADDAGIATAQVIACC